MIRLLYYIMSKLTLEKRKDTQSDLPDKGIVYAGSSKTQTTLKDCVSRHEKEGYEGKMHFAKSFNIKDDETNLIADLKKKGNKLYNEQEVSNQSGGGKNGWVYVIEGKNDVYAKQQADKKTTKKVNIYNKKKN